MNLIISFFFLTFANENKTTYKIMKRISFYGLTPNQYVIGCKCIKENLRGYGNYTIEEADDLQVNAWKITTDDTEYEKFLEEAINGKADVYALYDTLGNAPQLIGELAVFH